LRQIDLPAKENARIEADRPSLGEPPFTTTEAARIEADRLARSSAAELRLIVLPPKRMLMLRLNDKGLASGNVLL
jgi:hypothetical protein